MIKDEWSSDTPAEAQLVLDHLSFGSEVRLRGRDDGSVRIRRLAAGDEGVVAAARELFDHEPLPEATRRFLAAPDHHLLLAEDDAGRALGFVSGVETTHPDKGTEMFLYELAVAESARNRGVGRALVAALAALGRERGCYGMWVLTDDDNEAALRAYSSAGGTRAGRPVMLEWQLLPAPAEGRPEG